MPQPAVFLSSTAGQSNEAFCEVRRFPVSTQLSGTAAEAPEALARLLRDGLGESPSRSRRSLLLEIDERSEADVPVVPADCARIAALWTDPSAEVWHESA
jgi:hypothetical protein